MIKDKWGISNENLTEKLNATIYKSKLLNTTLKNENTLNRNEKSIDNFKENSEFNNKNIQHKSLNKTNVIENTKIDCNKDVSQLINEKWGIQIGKIPEKFLSSIT